MNTRRRTCYLQTVFGRSVSAALLCVAFFRPAELLSQELLIDKNHPNCSNKGPGKESRPMCNLWGLNGRRFKPGTVVLIKAGDYIGNEDPDDPHNFHGGISIDAGGTAERPFTLKAWPGDEGDVRIYSAKRDEIYAFLFWGSHIQIKGLTFVGHVDLPDEDGRLYSPRVLRFASTGERVHDIHFDSVRVLYFQGADDIGLGCRWLDRDPVGECHIQRPAEGWARGIDLSNIHNFTFENGEITCTDETGKVGLEEIRQQGLYLGGDGAKSGEGCSDMTFRNNVFYSCGHNNLMFTGCDSVLVENNYFENELHRSVGFTRGGGHTVRYNTFAAWEQRRVDLRAAGGNALQFRTSHSKVHHNLFYGGGELNHQGAITIATLDSSLVIHNEIFNNVALALNSMVVNVNDKSPRPYNLQYNRIYNNILIGMNTGRGVINWEASARDDYKEGLTFGNEISNNILFSPTGDPAVRSTTGFQSPIDLSVQEFNQLKVASDNMAEDPGLADLNFENPDFHLARSCVAVDAGLPIDVPFDFDGKPIARNGEKPEIGPYAADFTRLQPPVLSRPVNGRTGVPPFTEFVWNPTDEGDRYHVQVSLDSTFTEPLIDLDGLSTTDFLIQQPLAYNTTFFWRTRVSGADGVVWPESSDCTPWSSPSAFTIAVGTGADENAPPPHEFALSANYPNPFSQSTNIDFTVPRQSFVNLTIFDMLGRVVTEVVNGQVPVGRHSVVWRAQTAASGPYFYRLKAGDFVQTRIMVLD